MTTQCEFGKSLLVLGKPSGLSELAARRRRCSLGVRPLLQTQQGHMSLLSSKSHLQQTGISKLYFLLESSGLLPSDAIFTSGNNVLKGRPQSSTQS